MKSRKPRFFMCDCTSHGLTVERLEIDFGDGTFDRPEEIEISIWQSPSCGYHTLREKLSDIWQILKYGNLSGDWVILDKISTIELRDHLTDLINEMDGSASNGSSAQKQDGE